jgi:hypothetical protein
MPEAEYDETGMLVLPAAAENGASGASTGVALTPKAISLIDQLQLEEAKDALAPEATSM